MSLLGFEEIRVKKVAMWLWLTLLAPLTLRAQQPAPAVPELDGHATLTVGTVSLSEGSGFKLLASSGGWVTGTIRVVGQEKNDVPQMNGAVLLVSHAPTGKTSLDELHRYGQSGAAMVVVIDDASTQQMWAEAGSKTQLPMGLQGEGSGPTGATIVAVSRETMDKLLAVKDGESAVLAVHPRQRTAPMQGHAGEGN